MELKKAVKLGYTIIQLFECCWHYDTTTIYDKSTGSTGLLSQYMDAFIGLKVKASGYPDNIDTQERENNFIKEIFEREGVHLNKNNIKHNPGSRAVAKLCLNNPCGKLGQRSNMSTSEFIRHPREFFDLLTSDEIDVQECLVVNEDCIFVKYKNNKGFEKMSPNANPIIASYVTSHARLVLYSYLGKNEKRVIYCDTDSIVY